MANLSTEEAAAPELGIIAKLYGEFMQTTLERSWAIQGREERRKRLECVIALSVELTKIRAVTNNATRIGASAIEAVIAGDWELANDYAGDLDYAFDGSPGAAAELDLWKPFIAIVRGAYEHA
jgi:hypothetical protein